MIAVNERLGYRIVGRELAFQRRSRQLAGDRVGPAQWRANRSGLTQGPVGLASLIPPR